MKKVIINENQKGFLFKNGKYVKTLDAGKYLLYGDRKIVMSDGKQAVCPDCPLDVLLADKNFAERVVVTEVGDEQIVFHFVNGSFAGALSSRGKYAFWKNGEEHEFRTADTSSPEVEDDFPKYIFDKIPASLYSKVEVKEYQKARLNFDNKFVRLLEPGVYYFWKSNVKTDVGYADTRLTQMNVMGQEIMTQDKVSLRINFVFDYRITDCAKVLSEVDDFTEHLHVAAQLALRDFVGQYRLDDILAAKEKLSAYVLSRLKEKEKELFVEITGAGVKDIILPGEVREIMNTVLVAEKKAQANVISRREEVASTRSLLNTAKLMEENKTLYRLKELEYVERICEHVGNISLSGDGDMLTKLVGMIGGRGTGGQR